MEEIKHINAVGREMGILRKEEHVYTNRILAMKSD